MAKTKPCKARAPGASWWRARITLLLLQEGIPDPLSCHHLMVLGCVPHHKDGSEFNHSFWMLSASFASQ